MMIPLSTRGKVRNKGVRDVFKFEDGEADSPLRECGMPLVPSMLYTKE